MKLASAHSSIEARNLELKEAEHRVSQAQLVQEAEKALIKGLTIEKKHLQSGLEENIALKD
jgi:hypothetical protein